MPPARPDRRLVWIVRLVFYPGALALVVLALHHRHAAGTADAAPPRPARAEAVGYVGTADDGELATAVVQQGRVRLLRLRHRLWCGAALAGRGFRWDETGLARRGTVVTAAEGPGHAYAWPRYPRATAAFRVRARLVGDTLDGTFAVQVVPHARRGPALCWSGAVAFRLVARRG